MAKKQKDKTETQKIYEPYSPLKLLIEYIIAMVAGLVSGWVVLQHGTSFANQDTLLIILMIAGYFGLLIINMGYTWLSQNRENKIKVNSSKNDSRNVSQSLIIAIISLVIAFISLIATLYFSSQNLQYMAQANAYQAPLIVPSGQNSCLQSPWLINTLNHTFVYAGSLIFINEGNSPGNIHVSIFNKSASARLTPKNGTWSIASKDQMFYSLNLLTNPNITSFSYSVKVNTSANGCFIDVCNYSIVPINQPKFISQSQTSC